jgi:tyrosyl-tRNA synthetase
MSKIITDKKIIDEFLERGIEEFFPSKEEMKKLLTSGKKLKVYCGFDPSSSSLQIGNTVLINKLGAFQRLGHEVTFLIGDFTGMIGDPTDKKATRKKMTREEALENAKNFTRQAEAYLSFSGDNAVKIRYNSEWLDKITFADLIELTSNFTVQQMIQRDMFQERLKNEKPIHLHEFLYPVAQAYDSVYLDVDVEIGGNDQMFNMLRGRDLMKILKNKEKMVFTMKILADEKGTKMGKSEGNAVYLSESANNMFGQIMSWPDGVIGIGFELCTNVEYSRVKEIYNEVRDSKNNPRDYKMELAFEITKINHGEKKAIEARDNFIKTFQKKEVPDKVEELRIGDGENIADFLVESGLASSRGDARRKIEQGGVRIDGKTIKKFDEVLDKTFNNKIINVGKKEFRRIVVK